MRSLKNRNACRAPENSMVMRLLIMPVENSACAAKRRSRETAVCAAMTAAHQKSSVLYCAFHVCRAVRKICGMGCGSMSKSSSGCSASGNRNRRASAGMTAKRKTSAGKIFWPVSLKKGKRNQEYSPCKMLNSSNAGSIHKSSSAVCKARLHAVGKGSFSIGFFAACAAYTISTSAAAHVHSSPAQRSAASARPCAYPCVSVANRAGVRQIAAALESSV